LLDDLERRRAEQRRIEEQAAQLEAARIAAEAARIAEEAERVAAEKKAAEERSQALVLEETSRTFWHRVLRWISHSESTNEYNIILKDAGEGPGASVRERKARLGQFPIRGPSQAQEQGAVAARTEAEPEWAQFDEDETRGRGFWSALKRVWTRLIEAINSLPGKLRAAAAIRAEARQERALAKEMARRDRAEARESARQAKAESRQARKAEEQDKKTAQQSEIEDRKARKQAEKEALREAKLAQIEARKAEEQARKEAQQWEIEDRKVKKQAEKEAQLAAKLAQTEAQKAEERAQGEAKQLRIETQRAEIQAQKAARQREIEEREAGKRAETEALRATKQREVEARKAEEQHRIQAQRAEDETRKAEEQSQIEARNAARMPLRSEVPQRWEAPPLASQAQVMPGAGARKGALAEFEAMLARKKFYARLDDKLCPTEGSRNRALCQGNYWQTTQALREVGIGAKVVPNLIEAWAAAGAGCDCGVLLKFAPGSRLMAETVLARELNLEPCDPHFQLWPNRNAARRTARPQGGPA
jgi:hypothetical protein